MVSTTDDYFTADEDEEEEAKKKKKKKEESENNPDWTFEGDELEDEEELSPVPLSPLIVRRRKRPAGGARHFNPGRE